MRCTGNRNGFAPGHGYGSNTWVSFATAADAAKNAGFLVSRACYVEPTSPLYGSRIVNFVHDELIIEAPEEKAHEAAMELARVMVAGASVLMPDVPPKVEPLLMRRWSKKAKPLYEGETLIPWNG